MRQEDKQKADAASHLAFCDNSKDSDALISDASANARNEADRLDKAISEARAMIGRGKRTEAKNLVTDLEYKRCSTGFTTEDDAEAKFVNKKNKFLKGL